MIRRVDVTYGQLEKLLLSLGFTCRLDSDPPPARVYEHEERPEAIIMLPAFPKSDKVLDYHFIAVKTTLDLNGILDANDFTGRFKKIG